MNIYAVRLVDYDGARVGRTWASWYFTHHLDAETKVKDRLDDRERYPSEWYICNTHAEGYERVPPTDLASPVYANNSHGHFMIMYIARVAVRE